MEELYPLSPTPPAGSHKKVIYLVRHAEAEHNVRERLAIQASKDAGETCAEAHEIARKAVLQSDPSLRDAPLSADGTKQARTSGQKLHALFKVSSPPKMQSPATGSLTRSRQRARSSAPFRRPDLVLVSPLRRALETATELFWNVETTDGEDPPMILAIEALREKRTGLACDERSSVEELKRAFPHVDFSDVARGLPAVELGEDNVRVRARGAKFIDERLAAFPGNSLAIVSHKGWLRELRKTLKARVDSAALRADFDVIEWDKSLFGNAEIRVAAFRWQDGELISVVSRSMENAMLASSAMVGDGFEFALGPPSSGFSIFLADRTTKIHFISLPEGKHNVAIRQASAITQDEAEAEAFLLRGEGCSVEQHALYDARLTAKGARSAQKLRDMLAKRPSGGRPFTAFDLVIVSPITRALETANIIFGDTPGTYGGDVVPPPRLLALEQCRERFGKYVCDARRSVSELKEEFPQVDFSLIETDADELHGDQRESALQVQERALELLEWLSARPERCIAVVTHTEFLRHLFGQFGDTLHEEDRSFLQRTSTTCELRSVVLCSHGAVEREEQQVAASTIRVPSSHSMNSLSAFNEM